MSFNTKFSILYENHNINMNWFIMNKMLSNQNIKKTSFNEQSFYFLKKKFTKKKSKNYRPILIFFSGGPLENPVCIKSFDA